MVETLLPNDTLFPKRSTNGRALWGIHAILATILEDYKNEHRATKKNRTLGKKSRLLTDIEFDKMAHMVHLILNALYSKKLVSFKSVYDSLNGVHGPGPALLSKSKISKPLRISEVIEKIQEPFAELNPDVAIFNLTKDRKKGDNKYKIEPGSPHRYSPTRLDQSFPEAWTSQDFETISELREIFPTLTQDEIRALGTHQNMSQTLQAIEFNVFMQFIPRLETRIRVFKGIISVESLKLKNKKEEEDYLKYELQRLDAVASEIQRKSTINRTYYQSAYDKLEKLKNANNRIAQISLSDIFDRPGIIWIEEISAWNETGIALRRFLDYVWALKNIITTPKMPETEEAQKRLLEKIENRDIKGREGGTYLNSELEIGLPLLPGKQKDQYSWKSFWEAFYRLVEQITISSQPYKDVFRKWKNDESRPWNMLI